MKKLLALTLSILPSALKLPLYRLAGMRIGRHVRIGFGTLLLCDDVEIQDGASIGHFCLIRVHTLRLGKRATILNLVRIAVHALVMKSQSSICSQNEIAGDRTDRRSTVYLGPASSILQHCYINVARPITLGRNVGVGGGSYLFTHGLWLSKLDGFPIAYGSITIENDVWLPWGCFIMPNITIGTRVVVGARAVITKSLPRDVLAAGVPAKVIKERSSLDLSPAERARILTEITQALGAREGAEVRIEETPQADRHFLGERLLLLVHKEPGLAYAPAPALNVVFASLDREAAAHTPIWSLDDYTASPFPVIPAQAQDWFAEARAVGVRFYPIDEDID